MPDLALIAGLPTVPDGTVSLTRVVTLRGFSAGSFSAAWLHLLARRLHVAGATVVGAVAMPPTVLSKCTTECLQVMMDVSRPFRAGGAR